MVVAGYLAAFVCEDTVMATAVAMVLFVAAIGLAFALTPEE